MRILDTKTMILPCGLRFHTSKEVAEVGRSYFPYGENPNFQTVQKVKELMISKQENY